MNIDLFIRFHTVRNLNSRLSRSHLKSERNSYFDTNDFCLLEDHVNKNIVKN